MAPIVGGPAFISTAGTWTIQLQVPLSYSGQYHAGLVESEYVNHFLCYSSENIARSIGYLQRVGSAGLSNPTGSVVVPPLPKISSAQATHALLASQEIASITRSRVIDSVVSKNYVPILDLSSSTAQMLGFCRIAPSSLFPFVAHSPVRTGRFSSASMGEVDIGEQVVVYEQGYGMEAFEATKAMLEKCGIKSTRGLPANVMIFAGSPLGAVRLEIEDLGDVLVEVGTTEISQNTILNKLTSVIATNVNKLEGKS